MKYCPSSHLDSREPQIPIRKKILDTFIVTIRPTMVHALPKEKICCYNPPQCPTVQHIPPSSSQDKEQTSARYCRTPSPLKNHPLFRSSHTFAHSQNLGWGCKSPESEPFVSSSWFKDRFFFISVLWFSFIYSCTRKERESSSP